MTDFMTDSKPFETPLGAANQGYANVSPSIGHAITSMFEESSPTAALSRAGERGQFDGASVFDRAMYDTLTTDPNGMPLDPEAPKAGSVQTPMLAAEQANKMYAPEGTTITDKPIPEGIARLLGQEKARQIERDGVIARFENNHNFVTNFGVGLTGFLMDPLNLATMFVPGVGEEAALAGATRAGLTGIAARTAARVVSGAATGAVAQAPLTALKLGLAGEDASGYDMKSAFRDMFYNAAGGAIFSASFGAIGDVLSRKSHAARPVESPAPTENALQQRLLSTTSLTSPEDQVFPIISADAPTKHAAMSTAISQIVEGRPIDVMPVFDERDLRLSGEEAQLSARDAELENRSKELDLTGAEGARETLDRLDAVESQLGNENTPAADRRTLSARRDELLADTNPETLRAQAAPLETLRAIENERTNIADRLEAIRNLRVSRDADAALSSLPKLPQEQRAVYDNGFAPGIPQGEFEATTNAVYHKPAVEESPEAPKAEGEPKTPLDQQLADAEAGLKAMQDSGAKLHPEDRAELAATEKATTKADSMLDTFKAAAMCLKGVL